MAHGTTEEEFLYQLNLSKCQNVSRNLKKCINTRSKSKLRKPTHNKSVLLADAAGATKRKIQTLHWKKRISNLKDANLKVNRSLKTKRISSFLGSNLSNESLQLDASNQNENNVTGFCRICRRAYSSKKDKVDHFKSPAHIIIVEAKKGTNYEALKEESDVFKAIKFPSKCSVCGEGPFRRRDFLVHHRRHAGAQPYHCVRCQKKFFRKCDLLAHLRCHLGSQQRFRCPQCSCAFLRRASVTAHLIMKHSLRDTRPRNFKCTECGRGFLCKQDVDRHMRIHTGHTAVRCSECGKGCSSSNALQDHQRIHSGETPFKCDQCPYVSKSKQLLLKHQRKHTGEKPFKCQHCSFECSQSSGLKRHLRKHSGTKPYKCPYCNYRSANIENLRKHVKQTRKHKGLKVYPCKQCDFSTDHSSEYISHLKQKHFPYLDEENSSATKLSGILESKPDQQPEDGGGSGQTTTISSAKASAPPTTSVSEEAPTIEMVIVSDPSTSVSNTPTPSSTILSHTGIDKLRPEVVATLDEIFINALIKIPNLQQVILPPGDGNAPVTLVIGSDQNPYEVGEEAAISLSSATSPTSEMESKLT